MALPLFLLAAPATADVKAGVDAWQQGDYARAVNEWRSYADAGDPDAQFNMGQAYKLGRGVPTDLNLALEWFRKAAAQGHVRAEDNYGLVLFQQDKRSAAMPYIERSAARGERRAQYLLGTALFNGETIQKDWVRAYALMTRAAASGLPEARNSLAQMDNYIPPDQRQKGTTLAATLPGHDQAEIAAASLGPPKPIGPAVRSAELPPSNAVGRQPRPPAAVPAVAQASPARVAAPPAPAMPSAPAGGRWRVQLGAFSDESRARSLWSSLGGKVSGLSAYQPYLVKAGAVTRLQAGPLASSGDAAKLCARIKATGSDCIPKAP